MTDPRPTKRDLILEYWAAGLRPYLIAREVGCSREYVRHVCGPASGMESRRCFDAVELQVDEWPADLCRECVVGKPHCRGLCGACYLRYLWRENPDWRRRRTAATERWRRRNPDKARSIQRASEQAYRERLEDEALFRRMLEGGGE